MGTTQHTLAMEEQMDYYEPGLNDANVIIHKKTADNVTKSNKCNQCDFASSHAGNLRSHLITHSGEKSNKCNQCDFASLQAGDLRTHLKIHSGEKSNKCTQCDYAHGLERLYFICLNKYIHFKMWLHLNHLRSFCCQLVCPWHSCIF